MPPEPAPSAERGVRPLSPFWDAVAKTLFVSLPLIATAYALHLPSTYLGLTLWREQVALAMLGVTLMATFIAVPASAASRGAGMTRPPIHDFVFALVGIGACIRTALIYEDLMATGYTGISEGNWENFLFATATILLVLEAIRRFTGWPLVILVVVFMLYALFADAFPGVLGGRRAGFDDLFIYLHLDSAGILGAPLSVTVTVIFAYILLGAALFTLGGGQMFLDLALASMGRFRGGPAKAAVLASSLFGSVSGSAVANVATTGIVTIPLMKRGGFAPARAGAVEAVASTGGQLLPPIMGAAAFIMADFLDMRYADVALAALFPALLFYAAVFIQIHFAARKAGMQPLAREERPRVDATMRRYWPFLLPLGILIYLLFFTAQQPETAAILTVAAVFVAATVSRETRPGLRRIVEVFSAAGRSLLDLVVITAAAGLIIGVLSITGLGFSLGLGIVEASGGNLAVLLAMAAVTALVLGMGMPTTAVYILMATLIAPALVKAGIEPIAAHLYVLYFGVLSMITPPICLASFTAASIAGARFMVTGWESVRLGFVTFLVPLLFVSSPALLLQTGDVVEIVRALATGFAGCVFVAAAFEGFLATALAVPARILSALAGLLLMLPEGENVTGPWAGYSDTAGAALAALLILWLAVVRQTARASEL